MQLAGSSPSVDWLRIALDRRWAKDKTLAHPLDVAVRGVMLLASNYVAYLHIPKLLLQGGGMGGI